MFYLPKSELKNATRQKPHFHSVPGAGIEPARPQRPQDFKSCVSTSSTTRAKTYFNISILLDLSFNNHP